MTAWGSNVYPDSSVCYELCLEVVFKSLSKPAISTSFQLCAYNAKHGYYDHQRTTVSCHEYFILVFLKAQNVP